MQDVTELTFRLKLENFEQTFLVQAKFPKFLNKRRQSPVSSSKIVISV